MTRKLLFLNLALVVLICATGWRIWRTWTNARKLVEAVQHSSVKPVAFTPEPEVKPLPPLVAAHYLPVAQKLLFFQDRNPDVVIETALKPLPPLPVAYGVLDLGVGPTVILSKGLKDPQGAYRVGDLFSGYRVVRITATTLTLDFEGRHVQRTIAELKPKEKASPAAAKRRVKMQVTNAAPKVISASAATKAGPGKAKMGGGIRACQPGDDSPPGTVAGGYKKVVSQTPFGQVCRWEPVK